jgi:hypothetical protein
LRSEIVRTRFNLQDVVIPSQFRRHGVAVRLEHPDERERPASGRPLGETLYFLQFHIQLESSSSS